MVCKSCLKYVVGVSSSVARTGKDQEVDVLPEGVSLPCSTGSSARPPCCTAGAGITHGPFHQPETCCTAGLARPWQDPYKA